MRAARLTASLITPAFMRSRPPSVPSTYSAATTASSHARALRPGLQNPELALPTLLAEGLAQPARHGQPVAAGETRT